MRWHCSAHPAPPILALALGFFTFTYLPQRLFGLVKRNIIAIGWHRNRNQLIVVAIILSQALPPVHTGDTNVVARGIRLRHLGGRICVSNAPITPSLPISVLLKTPRIFGLVKRNIIAIGWRQNRNQLIVLTIILSQASPPVRAGDNKIAACWIRNPSTSMCRAPHPFRFRS